MKDDKAAASGSNPGSLLPAERHQQIYELLQDKGAIRVSELSERLGVSEMTIRRDLEILERRGALERTRGGAVYGQKRIVPETYNYETQMKESADLKDRIGRAAATLIEPHDSVFLHSGTTALHVLRHLDPEMPVRIYTNNAGAMDEVKGKRAELVLLGGTYRPQSHSIEGPIAMEFIKKLHPQKAFLTVDGISFRDGITTTSFEEAALQRAVIEQTRGQVVMMARSSVFGQVADVVVAPIEAVDQLVVGGNLSEDHLNDLKALGIPVLLAGD